MQEQLEREFDAFLKLEHNKYKNGHVTKEERASFEQEMLLLRSFRLAGDIGPNTIYRGD